jgi:hypothetical protein
MKKNSYEILDDWFLNLYEETLFVKCFEYSAVLIWEITGYRIFLNIDKKTWFVFLELWFPKIKLKEIVRNLENKWYNLRIIKKDWNIDSTENFSLSQRWVPEGSTLGVYPKGEGLKIPWLISLQKIFI